MVADPHDPAHEDNPFLTLGIAVSGLFADAAVTALVSPSVLASLVEGERSYRAGPSETADVQDDLFSTASRSYTHWDRFVVTVPWDDAEDTQFVWRRRGLDWQITNIIRPIGGHDAYAAEANR